jgi:hypothetical protein
VATEVEAEEIGAEVETEDGAVVATTEDGEVATVEEVATEVVVVAGMIVEEEGVEEGVEEGLHRENREGKSYGIPCITMVDRNATLVFSIRERLQSLMLDCKIARRMHSYSLSALSPSAKGSFRAVPILAWRASR